jgi:phosphoribosylamine--glycine ligase
VAAPGYPEAPRTGDPITGAGHPGIRHAGTALGADGVLRSAGGRVLGCVGTGPDLAAARAAAYEVVAGVDLPGARIRRDIAEAAAGQHSTAP